MLTNKTDRHPYGISEWRVVGRQSGRVESGWAAKKRKENKKMHARKQGEKKGKKKAQRPFPSGSRLSIITSSSGDLHANLRQRQRQRQRTADWRIPSISRTQPARASCTLAWVRAKLCDCSRHNGPPRLGTCLHCQVAGFGCQEGAWVEVGLGDRCRHCDIPIGGRYDKKEPNWFTRLHLPPQLGKDIGLCVPRSSIISRR